MNYKIWDKKELINGTSADEILKKNPSFVNDEIILFYNEEGIIYAMEQKSILKRILNIDTDNIEEIVQKYKELIEKEDEIIIPEDNEVLQLKNKIEALEAENADLTFQLIINGLL